MIKLIEIISYMLNFFNGAELFSLENTSHSLKEKLDLKIIIPNIFSRYTKCQICKSVENIDYIYAYHNKYWVSCKYCLYKIHYSRTKFLQNNLILCDDCFLNPEIISNVSFYRISKNILQKSGKVPSLHDTFLIYYNENKSLSSTLCHPVIWDIYNRYVSCENLIHYNRKIYGYYIDEYPIKFNKSIVDYITIEKIKKKIIKCYHIANEFYFLSLCLRQKYVLNNDLLRIIYSFWRCFNF